MYKLVRPFTKDIKNAIINILQALFYNRIYIKDAQKTAILKEGHIISYDKPSLPDEQHHFALYQTISKIEILAEKQ